MFNFFRINDPYRVVVVFIILLLLNLPFFIGGYPFTVPQLHQMMIGENLTSGEILYLDLWDDIAPFSAAVYWLIESVFDRNETVYHLLALLLIILQGALLNAIMIKHKVYNENSYTLTLIYVLLFTTFFDFFSLSPVLLSTTFLILAINKLVVHIQTWQKNDDRILTIGLFIGIGTLFFLPSFIFALLVFFSFIFFTGTSVRRNLLFIYGFLLPFLIVWLYYVWHDSGYEFINQAIYSTFKFKGIYYTSLFSILIIGAIPLLFTFYSILRTFSSVGYTNYQVRIQQLMLFMLFLAVIAFFLANYKAPHLLILIVIPAAFFLNHFFLSIRRKIWQELIFFIFIAMVATMNYGNVSGLLITDEYINEENLIVNTTPYDQLTKGKSILVLDQNLNIYHNSRLATPYFNYKLAQNHFANPNYYDNLTAILKNFTEETPAIIIDPNKHMPLIFERIPLLANKYRKHPSLQNVYLLK